MILDQIAADTKERVAAEKARVPLAEIKRRACSMEKGSRSFEKAVAEGDISFICEVKKASPSKGLIAPVFPYVEIAREYEAAGAACISCLTEPKYFLGSDRYLREIKEAVQIPVLRKDFTVDEYQIYQAKTLGADCVLLICALLDEGQLADYLQICGELGLSALTETHDEKEIQKAVRAGAGMIGVNNRNLKTFQVDVRNSERLRQLVPEECLFVAESGIRTPEDIQALRAAKVDGVLIGETLMKSPDKKKMLEALRG